MKSGDGGLPNGRETVPQRGMKGAFGWMAKARRLRQLLRFLPVARRDGAPDFGGD